MDSCASSARSNLDNSSWEPLLVRKTFSKLYPYRRLTQEHLPVCGGSFQFPLSSLSFISVSLFLLGWEVVGQRCGDCVRRQQEWMSERARASLCCAALSCSRGGKSRRGDRSSLPYSPSLAVSLPTSTAVQPVCQFTSVLCSLAFSLLSSAVVLSLFALSLSPPPPFLCLLTWSLCALSLFLSVCILFLSPLSLPLSLPPALALLQSSRCVSDKRC